MTTKMLRKFSFKDLSLAFKVRQNVWNALVQFDENYNQLFQSNQIRKALISILNEDQMEVQYVVNNVFRYDTDGDKAVTYTEFTNFCVEQHFGEMAIQRLHRMEYYKNGANRIMSLPEFQATLNYCLETINSKGTHNIYQRLFREIDLDRDGQISYQDYFIFLREYFGSQSQAFQQEQKNPRPLPPRPSMTGISISEAQQRFCRLIYSQFKITVMEKDRNKNMGLEKSEIQDILSGVLRLSYSQILKLKQKLMQNQTAISYESFIRSCVVYYMSDQQLHHLSSQQRFTESEFIEFILKICHFVQVKPSEDVLKTCFRDFSKGAASLSIPDLCIFLKMMFQNYKFDTRGLHKNLVMLTETKKV